MLSSTKALWALPRLARSVASAAPKKAFVRIPARAAAATSDEPKRAAAPRKATAKKVAPVDEYDDAGMHDLLPEIPPPDAYALDPTPVVSAAPAPTPTLDPPTPAALSSFPSLSGFPSAAVVPPAAAAPNAAPIHHPPPFSVPAEQREVDWVTSFHGMSSQPFPEKAAAALMRPLLASEIEIKPDGIVYLPEIQYRRILNKAFGPGGWGLVPRGEMTLMKNMVSREWGLVAGGRVVSVARGEQTFFDPSGVPTATEGCKSNALMRCCKDLGIASELWEPAFVRKYKSEHCVEAWTEHGSTKKKQKRWRKKGNKFEYPLVETKV